MSEAPKPAPDVAARPRDRALDEAARRTAAFFAAVAAGDEAAVAAHLDRDPGLVDARQAGSGQTALHVAVGTGAVAVARLLVARGADPDLRSAEGRTPLHDAIELGQEEIRVLLLEEGADVDVCAAAILGDLDRLDALLDADPSLANERSTGMSPLCWAAYGFHPPAAELLLARGARLDDGELLCAASVGRVPMGEVLLDHGADPDEVHEGAGCAALHEAARMRYTEDGCAFARLLLERGADPGLRDRRGRTALDIARAGLERQRASGSGGWLQAFEPMVALLEAALRER